MVSIESYAVCLVLSLYATSVRIANCFGKVECSKQLYQTRKCILILLLCYSNNWEKVGFWQFPGASKFRSLVSFRLRLTRQHTILHRLERWNDPYLFQIWTIRNNRQQLVTRVIVNYVHTLLNNCQHLSVKKNPEKTRIPKVNI